MNWLKRRSHGLVARAWLAGACALAAGCFSGTFLEGKQCTSDADCGPDLDCVNGYCGGAVPATAAGPATTGATTTAESTSTSTSTSSSSTTVSETTEPLTSGPASSTGPGTTAGSSTGPGCVCDAVDLLVIIDQSMEMELYEDKVIAAFVELFGSLQEYFAQICSYHIGFTFASDMLHNDEPECRGVGSLLRRNADEDCSAMYMNGRPYVDETDEIGPALVCLVSAGSTNAPEEQNSRPAQTILNALSPELNAPGACNDGFFRPEAALAIALITNAEDDESKHPMGFGSPDSPNTWFAELLSLNDFDASRMGIGAIIAPAMNQPMCDAGPAPQLHEFIDLFVQENTVRVDICDSEQEIAEQFGGSIDVLFNNTCS